jgi:hypothetical protein
MPKLLIDFITSLDGYGAADGWPGWWGLEGPEYLAWLGEQPEADYTVLMGATRCRSTTPRQSAALARLQHAWGAAPRSHPRRPPHGDGRRNGRRW